MTTLPALTSSDAFLPSLGITHGVDHTDYRNIPFPLDEEYPVWKTAEQSTAKHALVKNRIESRFPLNRCHRGIQTQEKLRTEAGDLCLIPLESIAQV